MSKTKIFLILSGYQATWLACIFGEVRFLEPMLGVYTGLIFLIFFFYFNRNRLKSLKIILLIAFPGYIFDSLMVYFGIYKFESQFQLGFLPIWMIVLWFAFATLFDQILFFFQRYKIFGVLASSLMGPLTYYLGVPIGVVIINNMQFFFIFMIIFWFLLMVYYLQIILKFYSEA